MYENNYSALKKAVDSDAVIVNISRHRNPDGTMNIAQFKEAWNKTLETFDVTYLWEKGKTPNYDDRDPLSRNLPSSSFLPKGLIRNRARSSSPTAAVSRSARAAKE